MVRTTAVIFLFAYGVVASGSNDGQGVAATASTEDAAAWANTHLLTDCFTAGCDYYGGDLEMVEAESPTQCQATCAGRAGCLFWTWIKKTWEPVKFPYDRCYLKDNAVGWRCDLPEDEWSTGPKVCDSGPGVCGGTMSQFECWSEVGSCENPFIDMDECREISFSRARSDSRGSGVCNGAAIAGGATVESPSGYEITASVELSTEVCQEWSSEESGEETQTVKVPGIKEKTVVACAKGVSATLNGMGFSSFRSRTFTVCEGQCPGPVCVVKPMDVGKMFDDDDDGASQNVASASLLAALLVGVTFA